MNKGFTLIEILVTVSITVIIAAFLITDFSRSHVDVNAAGLTALDAVREAQSDAVSGTLYAGVYRCGYGVHFTQSNYSIYTGPNSAPPTDCTTLDRNYDIGDTVVRQAPLSDTNLEYFLAGATDIFFEPPNPTTYIGGSSAAGTSVDIVVRVKNANCATSPNDCRTLHVTTSGQSQIQ